MPRDSLALDSAAPSPAPRDLASRIHRMPPPPPPSDEERERLAEVIARLHRIHRAAGPQ